MKESDVALLVVTKDAPVSTIAAVRSAGLPENRVIVVSNDSCDAANAELAKDLPGIAFVKLRPARGLTYCWNIGIRLPAEAKWPQQPTWTIIANDDIVFDADWLKKMTAGISEHRSALHIAMAYPKNRYSCFAVHRKLVREIGFFDERFTGMFYEDDDWHLRLGEYAKIPWGKRVSEADKDGVFALIACALHDERRHKERAKDRQRFAALATPGLSKEPNKAFFYKKWKVVKEDGWAGKGLPGRFARNMPEVEWYPPAILRNTGTSQSVLVTGGAGFIGSHLVAALLEAGYAVTVLDDLTGGYVENVPAGAKLVVGSVVDVALVEGLFAAQGFEYVYHLAAYAAEGLSHFIRRFNYTENLLGSVNLINASVRHGIERFIFTSSMAVYGAGQVPFTEDQVPKPEDPYGIAKYAVEMDLAAAQEVFGLAHTIFRPHNVYGQRQNLGDPYRNVVAIFMRQCLAGQPMTIFGDGEQTRAFSHVSAIIPPLVACIREIASIGGTYNIGGREPITIGTLAAQVAEAVGVEMRVEHLPARVEVQHAWCDHAKADAVFGSAASPTLAEGLSEMASWAKGIVGRRQARDFYAIEIEQRLPEKWRHDKGDGGLVALRVEEPVDAR